MKILVFDDNEINRQAAKAQLADHDLTVVSTYDKAQNLVTPTIDWELYGKLKKNRFGDKDPIGEDRNALIKKATKYPDFDAVLVDLLVPASRQQQGPAGLRLAGQEMPVGVFIALLAAKNGVKHVAVFTDRSHHDHPASACLDAFNDESFTVEGNKVILCSGGIWISSFDPNDLGKELDFKESINRDDKIYAKNWRKLLDDLIGRKETSNVYRGAY